MLTKEQREAIAQAHDESLDGNHAEARAILMGLIASAPTAPAQSEYERGWDDGHIAGREKARTAAPAQGAALSGEQARTVECADSWLSMRGLQTYTDLRDTLFAVLRAIGYTEEFAEAHPDLKVSEGVKLFLAASAPTPSAPTAPAQAEPVALVNIPDGWMLVKRERIEEIKRYANPEFVNSYRGGNLYDEQALMKNERIGEDALSNIRDELDILDTDRAPVFLRAPQPAPADAKEELTTERINQARLAADTACPFGPVNARWYRAFSCALLGAKEE